MKSFIKGSLACFLLALCACQDPATTNTNPPVIPTHDLPQSNAGALSFWKNDTLLECPPHNASAILYPGDPSTSGSYHFILSIKATATNGDNLIFQVFEPVKDTASYKINSSHVAQTADASLYTAGSNGIQWTISQASKQLMITRFDTVNHLLSGSFRCHGRIGNNQDTTYLVGTFTDIPFETTPYPANDKITTGNLFTLINSKTWTTSNGTSPQLLNASFIVKDSLLVINAVGGINSAGTLQLRAHLTGATAYQLDTADRASFSFNTVTYRTSITNPGQLIISQLERSFWLTSGNFTFTAYKEKEDNTLDYTDSLVFTNGTFDGLTIHLQ